MSTQRPRWPDELTRARDELDTLFRGVPYAAGLGAGVLDWGLGWAVVEATPDERHGNLVGTVHGGMVNGLADVAFEAACNSYGRVAVAISLDAHFASAAPVGERLRAEAVEVSRSRRVASYRIEVCAEGRLVAWFQAVAYRTDSWHVDVPADWRERY